MGADVQRAPTNRWQVPAIGCRDPVLIGGLTNFDQLLVSLGQNAVSDPLTFVRIGSR